MGQLGGGNLGAWYSGGGNSGALYSGGGGGSGALDARRGGSNLGGGNLGGGNLSGGNSDSGTRSTTLPNTAVLGAALQDLGSSATRPDFARGTLAKGFAGDQVLSRACPVLGKANLSSKLDRFCGYAAVRVGEASHPGPLEKLVYSPQSEAAAPTTPGVRRPRSPSFGPDSARLGTEAPVFSLEHTPGLKTPVQEVHIWKQMICGGVEIAIVLFWDGPWYSFEWFTMRVV